MRERAIVVKGPGCSLVSIVTEPTSSRGERAKVGVLFYNAFVVPRIGPHRFNVDLARRLARLGFLACRFDLSGLGESPPRADGLTMEQGAAIDFRAVMDELSRRYGVDRFVMIGICSGGKAALQAAVAEPRVIAGALLNTQAFTELANDDQELWRRGAAHYYLRRAIFDRRRWVRLLTGRSDYRAILVAILGKLRRFLRGSPESEIRFRKMPEKVRLATDRGVQLMFLYTAGDRGADHVRLLFGGEPEILEQNPRVRHVIMPPADHLLTPSWAREQAYRILEKWSTEIDLALPAAPGAGLREPHAVAAGNP